MGNLVEQVKAAYSPRIKSIGDQLASLNVQHTSLQNEVTGLQAQYTDAKANWDKYQGDADKYAKELDSKGKFAIASNKHDIMDKRDKARQNALKWKVSSEGLSQTLAMKKASLNDLEARMDVVVAGQDKIVLEMNKAIGEAQAQEDTSLLTQSRVTMESSPEYRMQQFQIEMQKAAEETKRKSIDSETTAKMAQISAQAEIQKKQTEAEQARLADQTAKDAALKQKEAQTKQYLIFGALAVALLVVIMVFRKH